MYSNIERILAVPIPLALRSGATQHECYEQPCRDVGHPLTHFDLRLLMSSESTKRDHIVLRLLDTGQYSLIQPRYCPHHFNRLRSAKRSLNPNVEQFRALDV